MHQTGCGGSSESRLENFHMFPTLIQYSDATLAYDRRDGISVSESSGEKHSAIAVIWREEIKTDEFFCTDV
jgi:hypothetical protein